MASRLRQLESHVYEKKASFERSLELGTNHKTPEEEDDSARIKSCTSMYEQ